MWNKIKTQLKRFKNWVIFTVLGVGVVLASGTLPDSVPENLKIKCDKSNITYNYEYTEYEYEIGENGKYILDKNEKLIIKNQKQIVSYFYKSNELAPVLDNEVIEKRTQNTITRRE